MKLLPGNPYPLGATWDGKGTNFAVFSENAESVELCLFEDAAQTEENERTALEKTDHIWHGYAPHIQPGQLYGFRVHGPFAPESGLRFNAKKILLDPYAKAIGRELRWSPDLFGCTIGKGDLTQDCRDSAPFAPLASVVDSSFAWGDDRRPRIPWNRTVIYEAHVKGFTQRLERLPEEIRGTYLGLSSEAAVKHLLRLGVTSVELMPIHYFAHDQHLLEKGLRKYWGYNTLSYFAPQREYASVPADAVREFKIMVRELHAANIEVILDVVYNHTAEGNELGPTLSFRGFDNSIYYRLSPENARYYQDFTGCGNSLNLRHPRVLQVIMDSLRYWVEVMHVDGFRFDLASTLARELYEVDKLSGFFDTITQDPVISQVKLIAEPWDLGEGGYQVGNFPVGWTEWNGKYRDLVRRFWKGDAGTVSEMATRLSGSSDLYEGSGRRPYASINFITSHDGFTLADLVSFNEKHNEANGEGNNDGSNDNAAWNCGAEGKTSNRAITALRRRQQRNLLATLMLSIGVPMLLHGDEFGRTQHGNNNAYCQDNETSWMDWSPGKEKQSLLDFCSRLIHLRRNQPVLQRKNFFHGMPLRGKRSRKDIEWLNPQGAEMTDEEWNTSMNCLGVRLEGRMLDEKDDKGQPLTGDTLLVLLNGHSERVGFRLPTTPRNARWELVFDTVAGFPPDKEPRPTFNSECVLLDRSVCVLRET